MSILRLVISTPKAWWQSILAPAEDPRRAFGAPYQVQDALLAKVRLDLGQAKEELESGFSNINSDAGLEALLELAHEYGQLVPVLGRRSEAGPLAVVHVPALVEETYRQGLSVLEDALELMQAAQSSDRGRLEEEVARLEKEIEALRRDESQAARTRMREERLASRKELLDMIVRQQLRIDELLHQADRCRASLRRARIELAALKAAGSEASVSPVTETLRRTINRAKEVQEELKKLGY
jgi:hypothetical protein